MSEILKAIKQICEEKGLSYEAVIETVESALAAAYRKDFGKKNQNIKVIFDPETGKSKVYDVKTVVEDMPEEPEVESSSTEATEDKEGESSSASVDVEATEGEEEKRKFNPKTEMQISDAKLIKKTVKLGDEVKMKLEVPESYGRMAAQTAKQVIIQRLREAERDMIFNDFKDKEHEVVSGVVQRREGRFVLVDLGKSVGVLPTDEQIPGEYYNAGDRIKVYVKEVASRAKGPEIILSRISDEILKKVFYLEIPEISNGLIEIKAVAREAGSRSKVAVWTDSENVDPIGSCVGQRGARIQTIIKELGGEKVDIIEYNEDPIKFIGNALSPAKIISINTDENEKKAMVTVASDQLSLAIGKGGQNARLAARLTGWKIDIIESQEGKKVAAEPVTEVETEETETAEINQEEAANTEVIDQPTE
jgi:transcription termination/antitermination protein NusA